MRESWRKKREKNVKKRKKHKRPMDSDLIEYSDPFDLYILINYKASKCLTIVSKKKKKRIGEATCCLFEQPSVQNNI
jgi:hypothetical protein